MTDLRSGYDEDSLPWLQEVEDEDGPRGISARAMLVGVLVVLLVAAALGAGFYWLGSRGGGFAGEPELIKAPATPYKVKPDEPGGLDVTGESQTTFETSAGQDVDSRLNLGATGREDVSAQQQPRAAEEEGSKAKPAEAPPAPKPVPAPKASGAPGSVIQLGAFKDTAQAERAWSALSARFGVLSSMTKIVVPYAANGSSGYRLRAAASSPDAARAACQTIQAGGESCFIAH
jgi:cell division protein FtsN